MTTPFANRPTVAVPETAEHTDKDYLRPHRLSPQRKIASPKCFANYWGNLFYL